MTVVSEGEPRSTKDSWQFLSDHSCTFFSPSGVFRSEAEPTEPWTVTSQVYNWPAVRYYSYTHAFTNVTSMLRCSNQCFLYIHLFMAAHHKLPPQINFSVFAPARLPLPMPTDMLDLTWLFNSFLKCYNTFFLAVFKRTMASDTLSCCDQLHSWDVLLDRFMLYAGTLQLLASNKKSN